MTTLADLHPDLDPDLDDAIVVPAGPEPLCPEPGRGGFRDCRGVFHAWDEGEAR